MLTCERCGGVNPESKPLTVHGNKLKCDDCIRTDKAILREIGAREPRPNMYWRPREIEAVEPDPKIRPYWRRPGDED
jgi:hypothetical protein